MRYWTLNDWLFSIFIAGVVALCIWFTWIVIDYATAETFELRQDTWTCTSALPKTRVIMVGKTSSVQTTLECQVWTRNPK